MMDLRGADSSIRMHAELALDWARSHGVDVTVTSVRRSRKEQEELYRKYQRCVEDGLFPWATGCKYPAAPPGYSAHEYGLAFDTIVDDLYMQWWAGVRRAVGFHVPTSDLIHAEHPGWAAWISQQANQ